MAFLVMDGRPDFVAGNTRLRARLPEVARVAAEADPAVRHRLGRELLRAVVPAYTDTARDVVGVLLARHDLADTVALLRGALRNRQLPDRLAAVEAVGAVSPAAAADVAHADDGAAAITRLHRWRLPDPATALRLPAIWTGYELHRDIEELELDTYRAAHDSWQARLQRHHKIAAPLLELLAEERDLANVRTVLRMPARDQPQLLPFGRLGAADLTAVGRRDWQPVLRRRPEWRAPIQRLGPNPFPTDLERAVLAIRSARIRGALRFGDVFGVEIPVAYVLSVEEAARTGPASDQRPAPNTHAQDRRVA